MFVLELRMLSARIHSSNICQTLWRYRRWVLWISLVFIIGGETFFWWSGVRSGLWDLPAHSRYTVLQGEPVTGVSRVVVNFHHFFLFWEMPPDTSTYHTLYDLWVSDQSSPWRNLLHIIIFSCAPFVLLRGGRLRAWESIIWLQALSVLREYVGEGWRLEPSFSDLWVDTICMLIGTWIVVRFQRRKIL